MRKVILYPYISIQTKVMNTKKPGCEEKNEFLKYAQEKIFLDRSIILILINNFLFYYYLLILLY